MSSTPDLSRRDKHRGSWRRIMGSLEWYDDQKLESPTSLLEDGTIDRSTLNKMVDYIN